MSAFDPTPAPRSPGRPSAGPAKKNERAATPEAPGAPIHTYDGIREYDNSMPRWLALMFWATVVFAPVYVLGVHVFGWIPTYEEDLAASQAELAHIREVYAATGPAFKTDAGALAEYASDAAMQQAGAAVYASTCAACHGDKGQGGIGPNLADAFWIHGHTPEAVYRTISEGVPANGMPAWSGSLSDEQRAQLVAFIATLQGTNPPGAKPPQGERAAG